MDKKEKLKGIIAGIVTVAVIGFFVWLMMVNLVIGIVVLVVFCVFPDCDLVFLLVLLLVLLLVVFELTVFSWTPFKFLLALINISVLFIFTV